MPRLALLLALLALLAPAAAVLQLAHFTASFLLGLAPAPFSAPSCGTNLGGDRVQLDATAAINASAIPVSPRFYFHDGARCTARAPSHAAFLLFHRRLPPLPPALARLARALPPAAAVAATAAHQPTRARRAVLAPGPVRCGPRLVHAALFARVSAPHALLGVSLEPGRLYAALATGERGEDTCWYKGYSTAPDEPVAPLLPDGPAPPPPASDGQGAQAGQGDGEAGGDAGGEAAGGGGVGTVIAGMGGVAGLAAVLAGVTGACWWHARRAEGGKDGEAEESGTQEEVVDAERGAEGGEKDGDSGG